MIFNIRYLQYLDSVYRHRSLTRASEELYVSQPAISTAITALEKDLGYKLLVRGTKGVTFTVEGEHLMLYVSRILQDLKDADAAAKELSSSVNSTMRIGISPTLGTKLVHRMYSEFLPNWPDAELCLYEGSMGRQITGIKEDSIDIAFNALPEKQDIELNVVPVTSAKVCVVLRPDHPLAAYDVIPLSALQGQGVVMMDDKSSIRQLLLTALGKAGVAVRIISSHEQILGIFQMIKYGNYVGFINCDPGSDSYSMLDSELVMRPLDEDICLQVGFFYAREKYLPKIARDFISFAKETFKDNNT